MAASFPKVGKKITLDPKNSKRFEGREATVTRIDSQLPSFFVRLHGEDGDPDIEHEQGPYCASDIRPPKRGRPKKS